MLRFKLTDFFYSSFFTRFDWLTSLELIIYLLLVFLSQNFFYSLIVATDIVFWISSCMNLLYKISFDTYMNESNGNSDGGRLILFLLQNSSLQRSYHSKLQKIWWGVFSKSCFVLFLLLATWPHWMLDLMQRHGQIMHKIFIHKCVCTVLFCFSIKNLRYKIYKKRNDDNQGYFIIISLLHQLFHKLRSTFQWVRSVYSQSH